MFAVNTDQICDSLTQLSLRTTRFQVGKGQIGSAELSAALIPVYFLGGRPGVNLRAALPGSHGQWIGHGPPSQPWPLIHLLQPHCRRRQFFIQISLGRAGAD